MKSVICILSLVIGINVSAQNISIIPAPVKMEIRQGNYMLNKNTEIATTEDAGRQSAAFLNDYLKKHYAFTLDVDRQETKKYIRLVLRKFIKAPETDGYSLDVTEDGITIEGDTPEGIFYGIQTLIQLLPVPETNKQPAQQLGIPFVSIQDAPRFKYRSMHLDVTRHFFNVDYIKKYIDYLAFHKMNYFHWHLTDDQGWRIEIKKYPELTGIGSVRNGTIIGRYPGKGNDNIMYDGFYTQEEVKEVVKYATERYITVIPEIEMPGHASAAIAAYNWLSCFPKEPTKIPANMISDKSKAELAAGRVKLVQETWGVFDDVFCAGKDSTFLFLQDVMDEVLALFPSKYIHVGGDESPKANWKRCPNCQRRIKEEKLKDEHELQSYFVQRMEKYINNKGRIIIGWDEILEGGLAPNAIVMSWRGEAGGIEAARQNHQVIMTPQKPVYFDHSQTKNEDSVTIGGYNPLEAVYAYEPIPKVLNEEQAKYVLGAQANVWTEYIKNEKKVEYSIFPRMSALSEVLWSPKEKRNFADFEKRLATQFKRYQLWNANFSGAYFDLGLKVSPAKNQNGINVGMETRQKDGRIQYQLGNDPKQIRYASPLYIQKNNTIKAFLYQGDVLRNTITQPFFINKATGKKITLTNPPSENYPGDGAFTLVNGIQNTKGLASSGEFIGFNGKDCEAIIDLATAQNISTVKVHALNQTPSWIHKPAYVQVWTSPDGKKFTAAGKSSQVTGTTNALVTIKTKPIKTRYVKVLVKNFGKIPAGMQGEGQNAWLFVDEIEVL